MVLKSPLVYLCAAVMLGGFTTAEEIAIEEQEKLNACLQKLDEAPSEAYEDGLAWLSEGNRPGARYCTAMALIELGETAEGAFRLEALANAPDGGSLEDRALYLAQAGNAWLASNLPEEALLTLNNAIRLNPEDPDLLIDRARAHLLMENWVLGETDLTDALERQPGAFDAYLLRAETRLRQNRLDEAMNDVLQARAIDPENIEALLLRGRIREADLDR